MALLDYFIAPNKDATHRGYPSWDRNLKRLSPHHPLKSTTSGVPRSYTREAMCLFVTVSILAYRRVRCFSWAEC